MVDLRGTWGTGPRRVQSSCAAWTICLVLSIILLTQMGSNSMTRVRVVVAPASGVVNSAEPSIAAFSQPLPLSSPAQYSGRHFSQAKQDEVVDKILQGMTGGFFVESGAYDGVNISNSLFFEASRGWRGLLIEANPHLYQNIIHHSGRNASVIHACVSPTSRPEVLPFRLAGPLGSIVDSLTPQHANRISKEISSKASWMQGGAGSGSDIKVPCWPLAAMLKVMQVNRVDFWSLDTEGSEAAILAATDFDSIDVRVIVVEVNDASAEAKVKAVMGRRPEYTLHSKLDFDLVFVKHAR